MKQSSCPPAWPTGLLDVELYDHSAVLEIMGAALGGDAHSGARLLALADILRNVPPECMACGAPLGARPPVLGLIVPHENTGTALGIACCDACHAAGPNATVLKLGAYLAASIGARPICPAPGMMQ